MNEIAATSPAAAPLKKASGWGIAFAILIILAGIFAICLPFASGVAITVLVGWLLVVKLKSTRSSPPRARSASLTINTATAPAF